MTTTLSASQARAQLFRLLEEVALSHRPVRITSRKAHGILLSEEDWRSIQETLYLLSIPGMRDSIRQGLATPVKRCSSTLPW